MILLDRTELNLKVSNSSITCRLCTPLLKFIFLDQKPIMTCTWLIFFWAVTYTLSITCPNRAHSSHTYVSKWLFSRSYTSTLLHCFAKCSALFWCFDRILQSAPHSMTSRTMSEFPLLQACVRSKGVKITQPWSVSVPLSWEFSIEKDPWGWKPAWK